MLLGRRLRALAAAGAAALAPVMAARAAEPPLVVIEVGPRTVPCDAVVPRRCFEVRATDEERWRPFEGTIDGFQHREGHAAVLVVRPVETDTDGADAVGAFDFELVHAVAELPLGGALWRLERFGPALALEAPLPHTDVYLEVVSGGARVEGSGGCSVFSGPLHLDGEEIRMGPLVTTGSACEADAAAQERAIVAALEAVRRVTFYGDGALLAGDEVRMRFAAEPREARLTWAQGPSDPQVAAFNDAVAAAAGVSWVYDPVRVALAFIDSRGAPRVDVTRRDDRAESPRSTLVVVDEDGFLDDAVRGVRTDVVLVPDEHGVWRIAAVAVATRCWRADRLLVAPGEVCP
jgi:heat shock protein HslJ